MQFGRLLSTGMFSDLLICCGGKEFKVHKNILYLQSSYFRKLLGGKFKVGIEQPGRRSRQHTYSM